MSQSTVIGSEPRVHAYGGQSEIVIDAEADMDSLLDILQDASCRDILKVTSEESLSANEISSRCNIPLSTTYRKLELLTDEGLLTEGTRLRRSGKHVSEYSRNVGDVTISVTDDGEFEMTVAQCELSEESLGSALPGGR